MALILIATPGGATANSYETLTGANAYFDGRPGSDAWLDAADAEKEQALVAATTSLDARQYAGSRASGDQALAWPRYGVIYDGVELDSVSIPAVVRRACCEEALALLGDPTRNDATGLEAFSSVNVGPIAVTMHQGASSPGGLTPLASRLLSGVLAGGGSPLSQRFIRS